MAKVSKTAPKGKEKHIFTHQGEVVKPIMLNGRMVWEGVESGKRVKKWDNHQVVYPKGKERD